MKHKEPAVDAVTIPHEMLIRCAKDGKVTKKSHKVFLYLLTLNLEESISQKDISEALGMDKSSVSLAIRELRDGDYLNDIPSLKHSKFNDGD